MKYTQEELEGMGDFEINSLVAGYWLPCDFHLNVNEKTVDLISTQTYLGAHGEPYEKEEKYAEFNPSNKPSDIMPIAIDNGINLLAPDLNDRWCATNDLSAFVHPRPTNCIFTASLSPYRAIAIVYLLMRGGNDE